MARFNQFGIEDLIGSFENLANIPDGVLDEMLNAGADVIAEKQKAVGRRMGVHLTGVTLESIKKHPKIGTTKDGRYIDIYPDGKNADGNRNAEVAFINEFGKRGQDARPFMETANEESAGETTEAAAKVLHDWQESQ
jgi:HK97 gp10 family phage protein